MGEMGKQFAHATVALGLLPGQFETSTQLRAIVAAFVGETDGVQALEDALWDLYSIRWPWIATGAQLDGIGDIVGEPRGSADDEVYRSLLYLRIAINVSEGEPERVIDAAQAATGATEVHLLEVPPATVAVYLHAPERLDLTGRIGEVTAGGVAIAVTASESATPFVFGLDRDASGTGAGAELAYGAGWGESGAGNEAIGGAFTELFHTS